VRMKGGSTWPHFAPCRDTPRSRPAPGRCKQRWKRPSLRRTFIASCGRPPQAKPTLEAGSRRTIGHLGRQWSPTGRARGTFVTPNSWATSRTPVHPRPKAVVFSGEEKVRKRTSAELAPYAFSHLPQSDGPGWGFPKAIIRLSLLWIRALSPGMRPGTGPRTPRPRRRWRPIERKPAPAVTATPRRPFRWPSPETPGS